MRWLCLVLFFCFGLAEAQEYSGAGGWIIPWVPEKKGRLSFNYTADSWWADDYLSSNWATFTLTFNFENPQWWMPDNLTASGNAYSPKGLDTFAGGGIFAADDRYDVIGWYTCSAETNGHRNCNLSLPGGENNYGKRVWLNLQKTFENNKLCYLSGYIDAYQWSDEGWLKWHSQRLCD